MDWLVKTLSNYLNSYKFKVTLARHIGYKICCNDNFSGLKYFM